MIDDPQPTDSFLEGEFSVAKDLQYFVESHKKMKKALETIATGALGAEEAKHCALVALRRDDD